MSEYQKGDAYNSLKAQFQISIVGTEHHIEVAKTLAIVDAINDLEGHLAEQLFQGTRKRA